MSTQGKKTAPRPMQKLVVPIAGLAVSTEETAVLVTYSLGSCIAVCVHDPVRGAGGMIHFMLPLSKIARAKAEVEPAMFGDTGVPLLFRSMYDLGCQKNDLVVKLVGGGLMLDARGVFSIGLKNLTLARRLLEKNKIRVAAEDTGESKSRTVKMWVRSGRLVVLSRGQETIL